MFPSVWLQTHVSLSTDFFVQPVPDMNDFLCFLLVSNFYDGCASHCNAVILQTVLGLNVRLADFVFISEFFCLLNHVISFSLRQTSVLIRNGNLVRSARELGMSRHDQAFVGVDDKSGFDLWCATRRGRNVIEAELALKIIILCHCTQAFAHLDLDFLNYGRLVLHYNRQVDRECPSLCF